MKYIHGKVFANKKYEFNSQAGKVKNKQNVKKTGVLIPETFDGNGTAIEFALYTPDEDKFIIEPIFSRSVLENNIRNQVEIVGYFRRHENKKFIEAHRLTVT